MILVGGCIIAVHIEGVTATKQTTRDGTEHDGTSLGKFLLHKGSPLGIGIEGSTTTIGAGLLDHAYGLLVVAEELERVSNQNNTIGIYTTSNRGATISHVFGLAHIAHQRCYGVSLSRVITTGIAIQHIFPIEGYRRQSGNVDIG